MSYGQGNFGGFENSAFEGGSKESFKKTTSEIAVNTASLIKQTKLLQSFIENDASENEVEAKQRECHQLCRATSAKLTEIKGLPNATTVTEQQERRSVLTRLATNYQDAFKKYQQVANSRTQKSVGQSSDNPFGNFQSGGEQIQTQMSPDELSAMEQRNAEMAQLESDIVNVNDIFKELNTQVASQGEILDSIENNVEEAVVNVEQANQQLVKAEEHKRAADKKKMCLGITVLIIIIIIIVIIVVQTKK